MEPRGQTISDQSRQLFQFRDRQRPDIQPTEPPHRGRYRPPPFSSLLQFQRFGPGFPKLPDLRLLAKRLDERSHRDTLSVVIESTEKRSGRIKRETRDARTEVERGGGTLAASFALPSCQMPDADYFRYSRYLVRSDRK